MNIIGIDPGLSGAIALIDINEAPPMVFRRCSVWDMPTVKGKTRGRDLNVEELLTIAMYHYDLDLIVMEKPVLARPGEGRGSIGKFGYTTGLTEGIYRGFNHEVEFILVSPQKWKGHFGLLGKDKNASRALARERFFEDRDLFKRKKDDGRAEAALMALYGFETKGE